MHKSETPDWLVKVRKAWNSRNVISEIPFITNFSRGRGKRLFIQGSHWRSQPWFDLSLQDVLPIEEYGTESIESLHSLMSILRVR